MCPGHYGLGYILTGPTRLIAIGSPIKPHPTGPEPSDLIHQTVFQHQTHEYKQIHNVRLLHGVLLIGSPTCCKHCPYKSRKSTKTMQKRSTITTITPKLININKEVLSM